MENASSTIKIVIDERDEYLARWEIGVSSMILIITLIGNSFVLFALWLRRYHGRRRKLTRMYFFMMHLSIADLVTGIFNVLPQLIWDITFRFQGGYLLCKIVKFMQPLGNYLSSYVLTATAIDRYHAICHPMSYCSTTSRRSRIMVYSAWCFSLFLCTPQVFVFSYIEVTKDVWDCWATFNFPHGEQIYVTWFSITVFLMPFVVLVYTYIGIIIGIWSNSEMAIFKRTDELKIESRNNNREPLITRARIKTVKQMITVVSLYAITSIPFIGCQLWATWDPNAPNTPFFTGPTFTILALLSSLTSCVNPWIYLGFNQELRVILRNFFRKTLLGSNSRNFENELSSGSSTRSTMIGTMTRRANSIYRNKSVRNSRSSTRSTLNT